MPERDTEITRLLHRASGGQKEAFDRLFPLVYEELRGLARAKLRAERDGHTLNATGLVHEAYLRLVDQDRVEWKSRAHFFAMAALAMRRILVNHAKGRKRIKRGGGAAPVPLEQVDDAALGAPIFSEQQASELLELDAALERLHGFNPQGADVVQYRFFGGLAHKEIAEVTGVSEVTVRRRWAAAKAWLRAELDPGAMVRTTEVLAGRAAR
jgi:RNA polymerase sigma factor (TIGR02999 family)